MKPDIDHLTPSMLIDKSAFPAIEGGQWNSTARDNPQTPDYPVEPTNCRILYPGPKATQTVVGSWGTPEVSMEQVRAAFSFEIELLAERPDVKNTVQGCEHFTVGRTSNTATPHSLQGLPDWAAAFDFMRSSEQGTTLVAMGIYRGVWIEISYGDSGKVSQDDAASLVKAFNAQFTKLEAA